MRVKDKLSVSYLFLIKPDWVSWRRLSRAGKWLRAFVRRQESSNAVMALSICLAFSSLLLCMEMGIVNHKCLSKEEGGGGSKIKIKGKH